MDDRPRSASGDNLQVGDTTNSVLAVGAGAQAIVERLTQIIQIPFSPAEEAEKARAVDRRLVAEALIEYTTSLRLLAEKGSQAPQAGNPYMQLASYDSEHRGLFFGRQEACDQLLNRLGRDRLTVLHAESGAGKTSLLKAGLMPALLAKGTIPVYVRPGRMPIQLSLKRALVPQVDSAPTLAGASLHDFLRLAARGGQALVLIIDQFEEVFTEQSTAQRQAFLEEMAPCLQDPALPVRWVLALRAEWLSRLSTLQAYLRNPFANEMLLQVLSQDQARQAIVGSARVQGIEYDPAVVEWILDDLDRGGIAPQLQLVCWTLFDSLPAGKRTIDASLYSQGDARRILQDYLSRVISRIAKPDRGAANLILAALLTSDGRRHQRTSRQLAGELAVFSIAPSALDRLLPQLVERRLVSPIEGPAESDEPAYELTHDYMVIQLDPSVKARKAVQEMLERAVKDFDLGSLLDQDKYDLVLARKSELVLDDKARRLIAKSERALRRQRWLVRGGLGLVATLTLAALVLTALIGQARRDLSGLNATSDVVRTQLAAAEQAAAGQQAAATALAGELQSQAATATAAAYALRAQIVFKFDNYLEGSGDPGIPPQALFAESARLQIAVAPFAAGGQPLTGWKNGILLPEPAINLTSNVQSIDRQNSFSVDGTSVEEIHTFTNFDGFLGEYANPDRWEAVTVEALFSANSADSWPRQRRLHELDAVLLGLSGAEACAESDGLFLDSPAACFDLFYGIDQATRAEWSDLDSRVFPVMTVSLEINVAGGRVATLTGILAAVTEWDEDVRGLFVARFQGQK